MSRWTIARAYFEGIHRILAVASDLHVRDYECFGLGREEDRR